LALGLLRLELRTDGAALYPVGDPVVERTLEDRVLFREPERVVLLLSTRSDGPSLASREGFVVLRDLHAGLQALAGVVPGKVRSLATLLDPAPGQTIVELANFLDELPVGAAAWEDFARRLAAAPHGHGLYLSADGAAAALYVPLREGVDRTRFVEELELWLERARPPRFDLQLTGPVAAEVELGRVVVRDLLWLLPLLVGVIALLLLAALRSAGALLVAMTEVGVVLLWTLGAMGWTGTPVTLVTTILPIVVLSMSITDEIHLLDRLRVHLARGAGRRAALAAALAEVGRPIVLTSLTTAASLGSFLFTSVVTLRHFGLFAAFGVLAAMLLSFTLVPALVLRLPAALFRARIEGSEEPRNFLAAPRFLGPASAALALVLVAVALPGVGRLEARDSWIDNLEPDAPLVRATRAFDRAFWGSYRYDVVLRSEELAYFQFPEGLSWLERVVERLERAPGVGGVISHLDAHEIHAVVDGESLPVSRLPRETVRHFSADLMKISDRIDLEQLLSPDGRSARVRMLVPDAEFARTRALEEFLERELGPLLAGSGLRYHTSGPLAAAQATVGAVLGNALRSTAWTLAAVALILALALGSWRRALVCLLPLCAGVATLLGAMGWWGLPLGIATGMLTALTLGVGVDFGLHALHAYERARGAGLAHRAALGETLASAGRPILWNALVLALGLSVLGLSSVPPNRLLGLLLAGALLACCGMSLLLLPWPLERWGAAGREEFR
jgi:predicted RND superfamily exporter protein